MASADLLAPSIEFVSYEKMSEDTNPWPSRKLSSIKQWIALEKVHGANLSFTAQQGSKRGPVCAKVAKRGSYLKEDEYFFGIHRQEGFLDREKRKVERLFMDVCEMVGNTVVAVTVYGELFGGFYPHPSVPACPGVLPVQTEVVYCPDLRFMAYDIALFKQTCNSADGYQRSYLDYDVCTKLFRSCDLLYSEPLVTGSLQTMLNYPLGFVSKLPTKLGMPNLPDDAKPNTAEGIVVKPVKTLVLDTAKGQRRVIFKRKVEGFMEKKQRSRECRPKKPEYNQEYELLRYEMLAMVTEQRLVNVISKVGLPLSISDKTNDANSSEEWADIEEGLVSDVLQELTLEHEDLWKSFQKHPMLVRQLMDELRVECVGTVEQYREQYNSTGDTQDI